LFLCCFCFVVAPFISVFCFFMTYSASCCCHYKLTDPRNMCMCVCFFVMDLAVYVMALPN
jgi:hypothetical protein